MGAYRRLLEEALKDPRNTMFVLISETCIPLHHPALFYSQLMAESHISRVSSGVYNPQRWFHLMSTDSLKSTHFQKGDQWLTLTRMHAELVSTDTHVWSQFQRYCRTQVTLQSTIHSMCMNACMLSGYGAKCCTVYGSVLFVLSSSGAFQQSNRMG